MKRSSGFRVAGWFPIALAMLLCPSAALLANQPPIIDSLSSSAAWVTPGGSLTFTVNAHDPDCSGTCGASGCGVYIRADLTAWSTSGGTLGTPSNGTSGSPYTASVPWQAPTVEGFYTVTVIVGDSGTSFGCGGRLTASATRSVTVSAAPPNLPPNITDLNWTQNPILPAGTATVTATATDPEGDPITFSWSVDQGTITASGAAMALYTAPAYPVKATVSCTATDSKGASSSATTVLSVTSALPDHIITSGLSAPSRVAAFATGDLAVMDPGHGGIVILAGLGNTPTGLITAPGALGLAVDWSDNLLVGDAGGAAVMNRLGTRLLTLTPPSPLGEATDVAVDFTGHRYVVLYGNPGRVVVYDALGAVALAFGSNGTRADQFSAAGALAVSPTGQYLVGDRNSGLIHVFDAAGSQTLVFGGSGGSAGKFVQVSGLAVDVAGLIYASDAFQSWVQVFGADGTYYESIGGYGSDLGKLMTPCGLSFNPVTKRMMVTSLNSSSIQVFQLSGAALNRPPSTPTLVSPADAAQIAQGAAVSLAATGARDPENQPLQYQFELDFVAGASVTTLHTWLVQESLPGPTTVDAAPFATALGLYLWKARAFDGARYSAWSGEWSFTVVQPPPPVNQPPMTPGTVSPAGDAEVSTLTPELVAANATDPDGDALTYFFELSIPVNGGFAVVAASPAVPAGASLTAWTVPADALAYSQHAVWRVVAFDGQLYGTWSPYAPFWTPPFAIPAATEVGRVPTGDQTRPEEIRYVFPARATDVTLYFQAYNLAGATDVTLEVNGTATHPLPAQVAGAWSHSLAVTLPASELSAGSTNRLRFLHTDPTVDWGLRNVSFDLPGDIPLLAARPFNTVVDVSWNVAPAAPPGSVLRLYRADGPAAPFLSLGEFQPPVGLRRDANLTNDVAYTYTACYVDSTGREGARSAAVIATPSATFGVTPITDLKATVLGRDLVLTWSYLTSDPPLQSIELYSDNLGKWGIDTAQFKNQIGIVGGSDGQYVVIRGADTGPDSWYLAIPLDTSSVRGMP